MKNALGLSDEDYKAFLEGYLDKIDYQLRNNEFSLAAEVLTELIGEALEHHGRVLKEALAGKAAEVVDSVKEPAEEENDETS